jgi:hypothetical protein
MKVVRKSNLQFMAVGLGKGGRDFYHFVEKDSTKIKLIPEPTNEFDVNAIKICIGDQHVGYVDANSAPEVNLILKRNSIISFYLIEKYSSSAKWLITDLTLATKRQLKLKK